MNGLDDLRGGVVLKSGRISDKFCIVGWTLNTRIQSHIDIYLSAATFTEVRRAFPYFVSKEFSSGGGDVKTVILVDYGTG
jgi:hypothetical protein